MPQKEIAFKSKHKLDLGNVSFDQRGKEVLGFSESEFGCKGIYDLVHPDDLAYVASAHAECKYLKIYEKVGRNQCAILKRYQCAFKNVYCFVLVRM